jgi:hypothetical protein
VGGISSFLLYMVQIIMNFAIIALVVGNLFKIAGASEKLVQMMKDKVFVNSRGGRDI